MLINRRLLTIMLTWQTIRVIANYNRKTSEIYLFKLVIMLFQSWQCKEARARNIMPVIDGGVFHNYVHMWKQLFSCDVIGNHYMQSVDISFASFSPFYKGVEEKGNWEAMDERKVMVQWMNILWNSRFVN